MKQRSRELNQRLIEALPGGVVDVGRDGSILNANAEAMRILGLSFDALTHRMIKDFESETSFEDGSPAAVSVTRGPLRTNSSMPSCSSSLPTAYEMVEGTLFRRAPAAAKEPWRAMASTSSMASRLSFSTGKSLEIESSKNSMIDG